MTLQDEADLELKLSAMRTLEFMGCVVRRNVSLEPIRSSTARRERQFTDADVLGVSVSPTYRLGYFVVECKTGTSVSTADRLLWLSGVARYWGAEEGWFVRSNVQASRFEDLASRLGVYVIPWGQLKALEELGAKSQKDPASGLSLGLISKEDELSKGLREIHPEIHDYLHVRYWHDTPQRQVLLSLRVLEDLSRSPKLIPTVKAYWTAVTSGQLALALCGFTRDVLPVEKSERGSMIADLLLGGKAGREDRVAQLETFHEFMTEEIRHHYGKKYPVTRQDFVSRLLPDYTPNLVDLVERLALDPWAGRFSPHVFEQVSRGLLTGAHDFAQPPAMSALDSDTAARSIKIAKDFVTFMTRSKIVESEASEAIGRLLEGGSSLESSNLP